MLGLFADDGFDECGVWNVLVDVYGVLMHRVVFVCLMCLCVVVCVFVVVVVCVCCV